MNKFLVLILFIALIYLAYSYRHDIIRGGLFNFSSYPSKEYKNFIKENDYTDDKLSSDIYKLYMNVITFKDLEDLFIKKNIKSIEDLDSYKRDISAEQGDENIDIYLLPENERSKDNANFISLEKLLNSENFKGYKMGTDYNSLDLFLSTTDVYLIDVLELLYYIENDGLTYNDSSIFFDATTLPKESCKCIPIYKLDGKVYTFDLWKLNDDRKTADEYLEYYNSIINTNGKFSPGNYPSPGLFIDSNPETMNDKDNSRKVGKTPSKQLLSFIY